MSLYAQFDEAGNQYQIASNTGWGEFGRWVEGLGANDYPLLTGLWKDGFCEDLPNLTTEIESALENGKPSKEVEGVGHSLFSGLMQSRSAEIVLITNGAGADDTSEEANDP